MSTPGFQACDCDKLDVPNQSTLTVGEQLDATALELWLRAKPLRADMVISAPWNQTQRVGRQQKEGAALLHH